jgi:hypothetical protein
MPQLVRPHLIPPVQATAPLNANIADDLVINTSGNGPSTMTLVGNYSQSGAWILHLAEPPAAGVSPWPRLAGLEPERSAGLADDRRRDP